MIYNTLILKLKVNKPLSNTTIPMKKTLILLLLTFGCFSGEAEAQIKTIDLLAPPISEIENLSEIASDVEYLPLQTVETSLFKGIYDIRSDNERIYIKSIYELLCFDKKGKFLFKLDKKGRGPEEVAFFHGFDIDSENKLLLTFVNNDKIFLYRINENGFVFLKAMTFKNLETAHFITGKNEILLSFFSPSGSEPLRNLLINLQKDTISIRPNFYKYKQVSNIQFAMTYFHLCYRFNNLTFFKEIFCDTIFTIDQQNKIKPYFILNSNGKSPTPKIFANISPEVLRSRLSVLDLFEIQNYLICKIRSESKVSFLVFNKPENRIFNLRNKVNIVDDLTGGLNFEPKFYADGVLYSWVDAFALKKYVESDSFRNSAVRNPEKKKALKTLADSLDETDNPVLIVVTPKK
jgi:hypothetical protein